MVSCGRMVLLCAFLAACGDGDVWSEPKLDNASSQDAGASADADAEETTPDARIATQPDAGGIPVSNLSAAVVEGTTIRVGPIPAEAGAEKVMCVVVDLGNEAPMYVRELSARLELGSHHMIIYRTFDAVSAVPKGCGSDIVDERMLFIVQAHESAIRYPEPAALMLQAHQHVKVEIHYFNDSAAKLDIAGSVTFKPHEGDSTGLLPVKTRFTGNASLYVPPGPSSARNFIAMAPGQHYFALTTHTHHWGVSATLERAKSINDANPILVHESLSWSEPPLTQLTPALTFDGEGVILTCRYFNMSTKTVMFGTGALNEMCFFWGYYYESP